MGEASRGDRRLERSARLYREALERLVRREPRDAALIAAMRTGKGYAINPTTVALEAGKSRNPLYLTHRTLLVEIEAAARPPGSKTVRAPRLDSTKGKLKAMWDESQLLKEEKSKLATQNLGLLLRIRRLEHEVARLTNRNARMAAQVAKVHRPAIVPGTGKEPPQGEPG